LLVAVAAMLLDVVMKEWVFNNLRPTQTIELLGTYFGLAYIENVTMSFDPILHWIAFAVRISWLSVSLFLFVRAMKVQVHSLILAGVIFSFAGLLGNYLDIVLFGLLQSASDFMPSFGLRSALSVRFISTFYVGIGSLSFR